MQKANVTVEMSHGTSNVEPYRTTRLTVSDAVNHHTIVEVCLTPEQMYAIFTSHSSGEAIPAEVTSAETLVHLNQKTNTFSRLFKRDWDTKGIDDDGIGDPNAIPEWKEWASVIQVATWSHKWSWRRQNNGIMFVLWRYDNELTDEHAAEIDNTVAETPAPKGLK